MEYPALLARERRLVERRLGFVADDGSEGEARLFAGWSDAEY